MPKGFVGPPAASYLPRVEEALQAAARVHMIDPFRNRVHREVFPPALPPRPNVEIPYPASTAMIGEHIPGIGSVENIVVDLGTYFDILRKIHITDDKISEQLHNITKEIDEICETDYNLPETCPQCLRISESVGNSLEYFRSLTYASIIKMFRFKDEIMSIK